ncbi:MAG TPA: hypothetical protein VHV54_02945 [Candidatus Binatia bacterium]|nr:hypothetical protein [Candidatus Binatia bacterium]
MAKAVGYSDGAFIGAARSANARHVPNRLRGSIVRIFLDVDQ